MKLLHSKSRLEGFSDAVFALAATLMVVSLDTPDNFINMDNKFIGLLSFGISFMALVLIWLVHYNFFRRTNHIDGTIITWNMALLFVILYFVFPLKAMILSWFQNIGLNADSLSSLFQLYGLGFCLIFVCYSMLYYRAYKKDRKDGPNYQLLFYARHFAIFIGVGLLSILLAYFKIGMLYALPGPVYALLGPLCYWNSKVFHKKYNLD